MGLLSIHCASLALCSIKKMLDLESVQAKVISIWQHLEVFLCCTSYSGFVKGMELIHRLGNTELRLVNDGQILCFLAQLPPAICFQFQYYPFAGAAWILLSNVWLQDDGFYMDLNGMCKSGIWSSSEDNFNIIFVNCNYFSSLCLQCGPIHCWILLIFNYGFPFYLFGFRYVVCGATLTYLILNNSIFSNISINVFNNIVMWFNKI